MDNEELNKILIDSKSGSAELALRINKFLRNSLAEQQDLTMLISTFRKKFSTFQILNHYLKNISDLLNQNDLKSLNKYFDQFENDILISDQRIYMNAKKYLKQAKNIFTLSNSRTLINAVKALAADQKEMLIKIAESRPNFEGRIAAEEFLKNNIPVELVIDAAMAKAVQTSDVVLIGADKILKNKNVINKTGSRTAAILANHFGIPVYVLASKYKFSNDDAFDAADFDYKEVWDYQFSTLKIRNYYFEEVEKELISSLISDD